MVVSRPVPSRNLSGEKSNGVFCVTGRTALARFRQAQLEEGKVKVSEVAFSGMCQEATDWNSLDRLQTPSVLPVLAEAFVHLNFWWSSLLGGT